MLSTVRVRSPGRVNLIGEHTDYNGGFAMPCALRYEIRLTAKHRPDGRTTIDSSASDDQTASYVDGVLSELRAHGIDAPGMDAHIESTLPSGAGLSSSAALAIAVALAACALGGVQFEKREVALLAQRAETQFAGTQCGIMDQYAVLFGQADCALFLDTRTLEFEAIPAFADAAFLICDTMVKRELSASRYNERRKECEQSVRLLQTRFPLVTQLRDLTLAQLEGARDLLGPTLFARCEHVVTENDRVLRARDALSHKDASAFGRLMNASHASLRDRYEVSCRELDVMAGLAQASPGVYGARMTGGGFGGCTINLVDKNFAGEFATGIARAYEEDTGIAPRIYDGTPGAGASLVDA